MASPHDLVRIEDPSNGMHVTVSRAVAERADAKILDRPATDRFGVPLMPKARTDKTGSPIEPAAKGRAATQRKEATDG